MSRVRPMTHTQIFLKRGPIFRSRRIGTLNIGQKTTIGFLFTDTLAHTRRGWLNRSYRCNIYTWIRHFRQRYNRKPGQAYGWPGSIPALH